MGLRMKGDAGSVWAGCRQAATLGAWSLEDGVLMAGVVNVDDAYGGCSATSVRLRAGVVEWLWTVEPVAAGAGTYRVSGPPKRTA